MVKTQPEPQSVRDIQVFSYFDNFCRRFIQDSCKIPVLLISILKTTPRASSLTNVRKFQEPSNGDIDDSYNVGSQEIRRNLSKINPFGMHFLTFKARIAFSRLKKAFTKVLILHYFDLERHIQIKTNGSAFAISEIFSQLTQEHVTYINSNLFSFKID